MGKTIVSFSWVMQCLDSTKILPTIEFEPKDTNGEPGPQRARIYFLNRLGNKLFQVNSATINKLSYSNTNRIFITDLSGIQLIGIRPVFRFPVVLI